MVFALESYVVTLQVLTQLYRDMSQHKEWSAFSAYNCSPSVYMHVNHTWLGFSFASECEKDKGMLKFQKRLNSGVNSNYRIFESYT